MSDTTRERAASSTLPSAVDDGQSPGRNLRRARESRGWPQEEMAFRCGVHRTYVGGVERGEYNTSILTTRRFTRALGIRLADAIRGIL